MRVLVISVHPDDETLGCGGALLKHAAEGDSLHWLQVCAAHPDDYAPEAIEEEARQVEAVRQAYPFAALDWIKLPAGRLETLPLGRIIAPLAESVASIRPEVVYVPHPSDVHSDHRVTFDAASAVLKSFYMRLHGVRRVLACEVLSETDAAAPGVRPAFVPTVFVDVTETLERKLEIFSLYGSEIHSEPMPRSLSAIRALARVRGAAVGVEYAEAYQLIREIA